MCPIWPFHYVILCLFLVFPLFFVMSAGGKAVKSTFWNVSFYPAEIVGLKMSEFARVNFSSKDRVGIGSRGNITVVTDDPTIISYSPNHFLLEDFQGDISSSIRIKGEFMGSSAIRLQLASEMGEVIRESSRMPVIVVRKERMIDRIFTISVAVLVSIVFINFGCALDWGIVTENLKKPSGIIIGVICQFVFMPLISFALSKALFPESIPMQLGLFFTGVSPSGGASNVWIFALGGNINLSIAITAMSTIASFFTMPLWTFTLGKLIFADGAMAVPYSRIASFAIALVIPLSIGFALQCKAPRVSKIMVRILKPFSAFLIVFIIIFATITNLYLFQLFTIKILLAGLGLPWLGYILAYIFASCLGQKPEDTLAISIETGVQNTGIAIFMLRFSLGQPEADLTTIVPVAVALMTPLPLTVWYFIKKFCSKSAQTGNLGTTETEPDLDYPVKKESWTKKLTGVNFT